MSIPKPDIKCKRAVHEEKSFTKPRILCSLSGCPCPYVYWQDGHYVQTQKVVECPKVQLTPCTMCMSAGLCSIVGTSTADDCEMPMFKREG
jgi:hypothetical protein